ncbi:hypothetical protein STEG23_011462, partial [Scotinomys teguina]
VLVDTGPKKHLEQLAAADEYGDKTERKIGLPDKELSVDKFSSVLIFKDLFTCSMYMKYPWRPEGFKTFLQQGGACGALDEMSP